MEGMVSADSPSLRNALRWMGQPPPGKRRVRTLCAEGAAPRLVGESIALTNVNIELDGNIAEGVITYGNSDRQTLQATLAADALDFTPYIDTSACSPAARATGTGSCSTSRAVGTDLDMRLSAAKVTDRLDQLGRTALGAEPAQRRAGAEHRRSADLWRHRQGLVRIARSDNAADVKAQFQFTDVDLEACVNLFGVTQADRPRQSRRLAGSARRQPVRPGADRSTAPPR